MTRMRYRETPVNDRMEIDVPDDAKCLGIHTDPTRDMMIFVTWLEEISIEEQYEKEET